MGDLIASSSFWAYYGVGSFLLALLMIVEMWIVFKKAGKHGWAAIIPIYNLYVLLKVAKRPGWWLILFIIPIVAFVVSIIVHIDVAKAFKKSVAFGVVMVFLPMIFFGIIAFGQATYDEAALERA